MLLVYVTMPLFSNLQVAGFATAVKTLHEFLPQLENQQPASLKIAALLHKPEALVHPLKIDYIGFNVPNKFLLGFGLDYDGLGRNLKEIYQLVED